MVRECIEQHISQQTLDVLRVGDDSERQALDMWADRIEADPDAEAF